MEQYKARHRNVWPEQEKACRRSGSHNYTLFLRKDGLIFGYFEMPESFQAALEGLAKEEVNLRWQELMKPYFEVPDGSRPDQGMQELEEISHLD